MIDKREYNTSKWTNSDFNIVRKKLPNGKYRIFIIDKVSLSAALSISHKNVIIKDNNRFLTLTDNDYKLLFNNVHNDNIELNEHYDLDEFLQGNVVKKY